MTSSFSIRYNRGEILTREDCQLKLHEMYGDALEFHDRLLGRVTNRQILVRMLNNLKEIYLKAQAFDKCLSIVDMMLMTNPEDCEQFRDRGLLRLQLRQFEAARKDLDAVPDHTAPPRTIAKRSKTTEGTQAHPRDDELNRF